MRNGNPKKLPIYLVSEADLKEILIDKATDIDLF
jgi:hypothetical protein